MKGMTTETIDLTQTQASVREQTAEAREALAVAQRQLHRLELAALALEVLEKVPHAQQLRFSTTRDERAGAVYPWLTAVEDADGLRLDAPGFMGRRLETAPTSGDITTALLLGTPDGSFVVTIASLRLDRYMH